MPARAVSTLIVILLLLPGTANARAVDALAPAPRWSDCTVELLDGTVYEHVGVDWKLEGFLIRLTTVDRLEIDLNPRVIARIYDAQGRHITQEVADASPSEAGFAVLGEHKDLPLDLGLSVDVGGSGGLTKGYGGMVASGAWFAGARYAFAGRWHVRAQYRSQYLREHVPTGGQVVATWTDEVSLLLGYQPIHPRRNRNYSYLELGPVLVNWRQRYDRETGASRPGGDPEWGALLRGGVLIPVSNHLGFDLGAVVSVRPSQAMGFNDLGWVLGVNAALALY